MPAFTTTRMLNFGDCDISGTAYYPSYLNMLNGVIEEFWKHMGYPWHEIIWNERWGTPTVHLTCNFSKPSFFGDLLTFTLKVTKVGRSSVTIEHTVSCGDQMRWSGHQVLAGSHLDNNTSMPWRDDVRAKLVSYLVPEAEPASQEHRPVRAPS